MSGEEEMPMSTGADLDGNLIGTCFRTTVNVTNASTGDITSGNTDDQTNGTIGGTSGDSTGGTTGGSTGTVTSQSEMMSVKPCSEPKSGPAYYKMSSNPRGFCLIFNIFEFKNTSYDLRKGSESEAKRLSEIFEQLYFIPKVFDNPEKEDIENTVEEYAQKNELQRHDAIVVIVLSHGLSGGFIGN